MIGSIIVTPTSAMLLTKGHHFDSGCHRTRAVDGNAVCFSALLLGPCVLVFQCRVFYSVSVTCVLVFLCGVF